MGQASKVYHAHIEHWAVANAVGQSDFQPHDILWEMGACVLCVCVFAFVEGTHLKVALEGNQRKTIIIGSPCLNTWTHTQMTRKGTLFTVRASNISDEAADEWLTRLIQPQAPCKKQKSKLNCI